MYLKWCLRLFLVVIALLPDAGSACTAFCLRGDQGLVVGKNFDFIEGNGLILVNKRGVAKKALVVSDRDAPPTSWTSRYGSVTFTWWGRDFPFSGMNEKGLVVCSLGLRETVFPAEDRRPVITVLQWVQYQLDTCATAGEVRNSLDRMRISPPLGATGKLHYFICDSRGNCAVLEFIDGKARWYAGPDLPVQALTNTAYERCLQSLNSGRIPVPDHISSITRFVRAAELLRAPRTSGPLTDRAFAILRETGLGEVTMVDGHPIRSMVATEWSIVFDIQERVVSFTTFADKRVRRFSLSGFDFSCHSPVKAFDVQKDLSGDITDAFVDLTPQMNHRFVETVQAVLPKLHPDPAQALPLIRNYPETTTCAQ